MIDNKGEGSFVWTRSVSWGNWWGCRADCGCGGLQRGCSYCARREPACEFFLQWNDVGLEAQKNSRLWVVLIP